MHFQYGNIIATRIALDCHFKKLLNDFYKATLNDFLLK